MRLRKLFEFLGDRLGIANGRHPHRWAPADRPRHWPCAGIPATSCRYCRTIRRHQPICAISPSASPAVSWNTIRRCAVARAMRVPWSCWTAAPRWRQCNVSSTRRARRRETTGLRRSHGRSGPAMQAGTVAGNRQSSPEPARAHSPVRPSPKAPAFYSTRKSATASSRANRSTASTPSIDPEFDLAAAAAKADTGYVDRRPRMRQARQRIVSAACHSMPAVGGA